jgi:hypothetical protein
VVEEKMLCQVLYIPWRDRLVGGSCSHCRNRLFQLSLVLLLVYTVYVYIVLAHYHDHVLECVGGRMGSFRYLLLVDL